MLYVWQADRRQVGDLQPASTRRRQTPEGPRRTGNQKILLPENDDNARRNNRRVSEVCSGNSEATERTSLGPARWRARTLTREKQYRGQRTFSYRSRNSWLRVSTLEPGSRQSTWKNTFSVSGLTDSSS